MADPTKGTVSQAASRFGRRLRFPQLFTFVLVLFLIDLVVPDAIPFADEILFGLLTVLLGSLRRAEPTEGPRVEKDVTPRGR
jgi:hypothetical protein